MVHLYGTPAKMDEICAICREAGVPLVEDAAEALGSEYKGQKCGTFGRFGVLSFNGNKIITTSGGGMQVCENQEDAAHALKLATQARENFPWYQHEEIGFNYRMSNICAGIGRGQAKVLPLRVEQKRAIYRRYQENLAGLPLTMQPIPADCHANCWLSVALLDEGCAVTPAQILDALKAQKLEGRPLWKPMHAQPVFANAKYVTGGEASVSDDLFNRGVCLPSDTKMSLEDVDRMCWATMKKITPRPSAAARSRGGCITMGIRAMCGPLSSRPTASFCPRGTKAWPIPIWNARPWAVL